MARIYFIDRFKENIEHGCTNTYNTLFENYEGLIKYNNSGKAIDTCSEYIITNEYSMRHVYLGDVGIASYTQIVNSILRYNPNDESYFNHYFIHDIDAYPYSYEKMKPYDFDPSLYVGSCPYQYNPTRAIKNYRIVAEIDSSPSMKIEDLEPLENYVQFTLYIFPDFYIDGFPNLNFRATIDTYKSFKTYDYQVARIKKDYRYGDYGLKWDMIPVDASGILMLRNLSYNNDSRTLVNYFRKNYQDIMKSVYTFVYYFGTWFLSQDEETYWYFFTDFNRKKKALSAAYKKYYGPNVYRRH